MDDGCLQAGSGTLPVALLTGEASLDGEAPLVGLAYFRGLQGTGAGFQYIQRVNTVGSRPGNIVFRDIAAIESSSTSFFTVWLAGCATAAHVTEPYSFTTSVMVKPRDAFCTKPCTVSGNVPVGVKGITFAAEL